MLTFDKSQWKKSRTLLQIWSSLMCRTSRFLDGQNRGGDLNPRPLVHRPASIASTSFKNSKLQIFNSTR